MVLNLHQFAARRGWRLAVTLLLLPLTLVASAIAAQGAVCPARRSPVGDLGYTRLVCDCTIAGGSHDAVPAARFRSVPRIYGIRPDGPGAGKLAEGDEIIAVDDIAITTEEGGHRFATIAPGVPVVLTVRRDGRTEQVTIQPTPLCPDDARAFGNVAPSLSSIPGSALPVRPQAQTPTPSPLPASRTPVVVPSGPASPAGWFGFALACNGCGWSQNARDRAPVWESSAPPTVAAVDPNGPAARAGIEVGDHIEQVDGLSVLSTEGAHRFGAVRPGDHLRLTLHRGSRVLQADLAIGARPVALVSPTPAFDSARTPSPDSAEHLRYTGRAGDARIDVWSAGSVTVTVAPNGDLIVKTGDATVRVRPTAGQNP